MAERDEFEFDPGPPRWLRPALWLSIPLAALSCGLVVQSIMALPSMRGRAVAEATASPRRPEARAMAGQNAGEIVQLARLRAESAAEEAHVAALIEAAEDLRTPSPEASEAISEAAEAVPDIAAGAPPPPPATPPAPRLAGALPALAPPPFVPWPAVTPVVAALAPPPEARLPRLHAAIDVSLGPPPAVASAPPVTLVVQRAAPAETPRRAAAAAIPPLVTAPAARPPRAEPVRAPAAQPADPRCGSLLARLQLGERPTDADRSLLQSACTPQR